MWSHKIAEWKTVNLGAFDINIVTVFARDMRNALKIVLGWLANDYRLGSSRRRNDHCSKFVRRGLKVVHKDMSVVDQVLQAETTAYRLGSLVVGRKGHLPCKGGLSGGYILTRRRHNVQSLRRMFEGECVGIGLCRSRVREVFSDAAKDPFKED
jgi:hypothetical protein